MEGGGHEKSTSVHNPYIVKWCTRGRGGGQICPKIDPHGLRMLPKYVVPTRISVTIWGMNHIPGQGWFGNMWVINEYSTRLLKKKNPPSPMYAWDEL